MEQRNSALSFFNKLQPGARMENLIPLINKLQDTFASVGLTGIELPQIAGAHDSPSRQP
jgi:hypothetical protein